MYGVKTHSEIGSASQGPQPEDLHSDDHYDLDSTELDVLGLEDTFPSDHSANRPHMSDPNANNVYPSDPEIDKSESPLNDSPKDALEYDLHMRIDVLANQTLFLMVQAWQDVIYSGQERYVREHPVFRKLMGEMVERGLMNVDWEWSVDIEKVDMAFARVRVENLPT